MREYKYRMWDKKLYVMRYDEEVCAKVNPYKSINQFDIFNREDMEFMQFTGLKDKNGKEIYEGDLLRYPIKDSSWDNKNYTIFEMFFHDGDGSSHGAGWYLRTYYKGSVCGSYIPYTKQESMYQLEVFGNIYENPELVKP